MSKTGCIDHIEVENFKSYRGNHVIPFTQFTSVIGPNGSGKSNLMDAISFVLGMKTQRLRSSNLRELVYKAPSETKPANIRCSVELVYTNKNKEQKFKRSIQADKGTSKYYIDDKEVDTAQYNSVLEKMGVIVSARNFLVFQGDVESIASKSPKELTAFIEKISGSEEYKEEYEKCRVEMEKAEENTLFTFNKKKTINAERKQYKEQKEEAERYHKLQDDLAEMRKKHVLFQLYHIQRDVKTHRQELETDTTSLAEVEGKQETSKKQLEDKSKKAFTSKQKCVKLETQILKKKAEFDKSRPDAIKLKEEMDHVNKRLNSSKESLKKLQKEYEKQQTDLKELKDLRSHHQEQLDKIAQEEAQASEKRQLTKAQLAEYEKIKDRVGAQTAESRKQLEAIERRIAVAQEGLARWNQKKEEQQKKADQLRGEKVQMNERAARLNELIVSTNAQIKMLEAREEERKKEEAAAKGRHEKLNAELEDVQSKLSAAKSDRKETDRDRRFAQALESMQRLFPAVRGRLVDLCQPTKKQYDLAITVAMGKYMDAIVVDDERTARECVQYLKEQRVGTCTFLPLDSIKAKPIDEKLRSTPGIKFVLDLLKFEPYLHNAILFAVGNTLVAEDIKEARRLAFDQDERNRVVTVKGVLIQKSGLISGGSGAGDTRNKWDESRVDKLKKQREDILDKLSTVARDLKGLSAQHQQIVPTQGSVSGAQTVSLENKVTYAQKDLEWTNEKLEKIREAKRKAKAELKGKIEPEIATEEKKIADETKKAKETRAKIDEVTNAEFADFCKEVRAENISQFEQEQLATVRERAEKRVKIAKHVALLKSQIDYESNRDVKGPLDKLKDGIKDDEKKLETLKEKNKKHEKENEAFEKQLEEMQTEQKEAKKELDDLDVGIKETRKIIANNEKQIAQIGNRMGVTESQIHQARARRFTLLQQAKLEMIKLPLKKGSGSKKKGGKKGGKKGKKAKGKGKKRARAAEEEEEGEEEEEEEVEADEDEEMEDDDDDLSFMDIDLEQPSAADSLNSQNTQAVHYLEKLDDIEFDFSSVRGEEVSTAKELEEKNAKILRAMQDVEAEMAKLAPNLKAVQRLNDVDSRLTKTNEELDEIRSEAKSSKEKFEDVKKLRCEKFYLAFKTISESIFKIYQDLTRSPDHENLHGTAYLHVENTEEPYLAGIKYTTMPPMKRFRDMEQLSGGEKTVAALALLFAAHTHRPSPFFILDEVDAALDPSNVQLVARYIRAHAHECQYIVISLKDTFYDKSHALVGICRDARTASSKSFTLRLINSGYPD